MLLKINENKRKYWSGDQRVRVTKWRAERTKKERTERGQGKILERGWRIWTSTNTLPSRLPGARSENISTQLIRSGSELPRASELNFKLEIPDAVETKPEVETQKWKIENGQSKIGNSPLAR
jgi:hypothetical protein